MIVTAASEVTWEPAQPILIPGSEAPLKAFQTSGEGYKDQCFIYDRYVVEGPAEANAGEGDLVIFRRGSRPPTDPKVTCSTEGADILLRLSAYYLGLWGDYIFTDVGTDVMGSFYVYRIDQPKVVYQTTWARDAKLAQIKSGKLTLSIEQMETGNCKSKMHGFIPWMATRISIDLTKTIEVKEIGPRTCTEHG